ncbi:hypothetical protein VNO77_46960 [Canavalia gladiata]|uniref:Uncharacterized protein n=1 Tax=Canavalia gladiata TaxID=3824 RepID=A0AAN9JHT0_CANGL
MSYPLRELKPMSLCASRYLPRETVYSRREHVCFLSEILTMTSPLGLFHSMILVQQPFLCPLVLGNGLSDGCAQPNVIYVDPSQTSLQLRGRFSKQEASGKTAWPVGLIDKQHLPLCFRIPNGPKKGKRNLTFIPNRSLSHVITTTGSTKPVVYSCVRHFLITRLIAVIICNSATSDSLCLILPTRALRASLLSHRCTSRRVSRKIGKCGNNPVGLWCGVFTYLIGILNDRPLRCRRFGGLLHEWPIVSLLLVSLVHSTIASVFLGVYGYSCFRYKTSHERDSLESKFAFAKLTQNPSCLQVSKTPLQKFRSSPNQEGGLRSGSRSRNQNDSKLYYSLKRHRTMPKSVVSTLWKLARRCLPLGLIGPNAQISLTNTSSPNKQGCQHAYSKAPFERENGPNLLRREVPYLLDRVHCLACTYLSQDWLGVQCQKNTGFQIIPAPRSLSSTSESLIEKARTKGA